MEGSKKDLVVVAVEQKHATYSSSSVEELTGLLKEEVIVVRGGMNSNSTELEAVMGQDIVLVEEAVVQEIGGLACRVATCEDE